MKQFVRLILITCVFCVFVHSTRSESISEAPATGPPTSVEPITNSPSESPAQDSSDKPVESQRVILESVPRATVTNINLHSKNDGTEQLTAQDRNDQEQLNRDEPSIPIDLAEYGFTQHDWLAAAQGILSSQDTQQAPNVAGSEKFDAGAPSQNPSEPNIQEGTERFSLSKETIAAIQQSLNSTKPDLVLEKAMDDWIEEALASENIDWSNLLLQVLERERGESSSDAVEEVDEDAVLASQLQDKEP